MFNLSEIRKYRFNLERHGIFNSENDGIALLDFIFSFLGAFIFIKLFNIQNTRLVYLSVIPFGIVAHHIFAHITQWVWMPNEITFLNKKIISTEINIYKLLLLFNIIILVKYLN